MSDHDADPRWDAAIELLVAGVAKTRIAASLNPPCHRNTLTAWTKQPNFLRALQQALDQRDAAVRLRRSHQVTTYADRVRHLAESALREAEQRPLDRASQLVVRRWLRMYRRLVVMEREVLSG